MSSLVFQVEIRYPLFLAILCLALLFSLTSEPSNGEESEEAEFWKQHNELRYRPCLDFGEDYQRSSSEILRDQTKYLMVVVNGGMNQERNQIVNAVVIAWILESSLFVSILQVNVIWGDERPKRSGATRAWEDTFTRPFRSSSGSDSRPNSNEHISDDTRPKIDECARPILNEVLVESALDNGRLVHDDFVPNNGTEIELHVDTTKRIPKSICAAHSESCTGSASR
ncbi:hypothetical protein NE237_007256 [Protea cynaroides]|uniref:O-fucosyltransferase family protein n=1 Tax=Protea cynaroides TaxID=273540 RepID=A0A9Q0QW79_9MAGN|nr:hypothetical protein NE237_007256 [Protea cynaroides]